MNDSAAEDEPSGEQAFDVSLVRELADVLNDTGLTEIEVERGTLRIRVAKNIATAAPAMVPATFVAPGVAPSEAPAVAAPARPAGDVVK
jgi:acetyl-CoA carboxylase biotin carboxyl carrier protein